MQQPKTIEGYRLSPQQARLWSLQQAQTETPYYIKALISLDGSLNQSKLVTAVRQVIARHEILRTTFRCLPGMTVPLQVIGEPPALNSKTHWFACHNLKDLAFSAAVESNAHELDPIETYWQKWQPAEVSDQSQALQATLIRQSSQKSWLFLKLAGLCADTATLQQIIQELTHEYESSRGDATVDEPIQYADLAEWQCELLESNETASGRSYWSQAAAGNALSARLPLGKSPIPTDSHFHPNTITLHLPARLIQQLKTKTHEVDGSLHSFLLTAWQALLGRLTGRYDLIVGTAFEGRLYEDLATAIGLLTRYLPVHCSFNSDQSFHQAWQSIREQINSVAQWQDYFTWETWQPTLEGAFFPFGFDYYDLSLAQLETDLTFTLKRHWVCLERFHINLSCYCQGDTLTCEFYYDPKVIDSDAVARLADQYQVLLSQAVVHPDREIGKLGLLSHAAREQLLVAFNPPPSVISITECIHQRFEQQARQTPDAPAVTCADQTLSYGELNQQANQLAHFLQQQGISAETPVALYLERSCSLIVGLLGILKAGGAYLPLDPALPTQGIALRLAAAQVPIVLTQSALLENCAQSGPAMNPQVICLDRDWSEIAACDAQNPASFLSPNALAYVIYTSGSTGQPKGVAVEHQQVLHYLDGIQQKLSLAYTVSLPASYASVSTIAADLGNTAIFSALCTGSCLHLIGTERAASPDALAHYNQQHSIDCLKIVPSHLKVLLASAAEPAQLLPRECLILGGEAASWQLIQQVQQLSNCRILNHYGPTETTVGVLAYEVDTLGEAAGLVPLGRPLANSQVYLLDDHHQPVPIGVPGEIYIGGATVARGYWQQPDLTAERFVDNPLAAASARLYRTGDRARYRPDGNLEFLGRLDDQVKIRGYRVELGEIETVLQQHPTVQNAVVVLREDLPGQPRLAAYVVLHQALEPAESIEAFVAQRLPAYMVPATFSVLAAFPLTPNGKVDRQALPVPAALQQAAYSAPQTDAETTLADIWAEVLGLEQVGIHDNFFSLGGDSILSIQVIARANQAGLTLTPKQLFEHQTVATLAVVAGTSALVQAEQGPVVGAVPLTPIQRWFFEQAFAAPQHWNQAVLLASERPLTPMLLQQTIQHLRAHHDGLRSRFVCVDNAWRQEIVPLQPEHTVLELIDLAAVAAEEQPAALEAHANRLQASLDLDKGALLRVALFDRGPGQSQRLLIIVHHLVMDGVSWRILLQDFQTVYQQLSQQQAVQLPPKTSSFQAWAQQLYDYAQSPQIRQELSFWQSALPAVSTSIPVDLSEGDPVISSTQTVTVKLTATETNVLLKSLPQSEQAHINELFLAALTQSFQSWIDQPALLVDMEGHGREALFSNIDVSRTLGWFTTVYPVRLPLYATTWQAALDEIKAQFQQQPNRGIGYGVLKYLAGFDQAAHLQAPTPSQVKFNYLGQFDQIFSQAKLFQPAEEPQGNTRSLKNHRSHLIEVVALIAKGQLYVEWTYSPHRHQTKTVEGLAAAFITALRSRITRYSPINNPPFNNQSNSQSVEKRETLSPTHDPETDLLHQDLKLAATIRATSALANPATQPEHILLTGATGFLGAFLLHELLEQTSAQVHCLIRETDTVAAQQRLQQHLQHYELWRERYTDRITPIVGDLSQPLLGLSAESFQALAQQIDQIYHNGASVNLAYPYSAVRATNVLGTKALLTLATCFKLKPIAYVSTLSVFSGMGEMTAPIVETMPLQQVRPPTGGYAQSKWVAERLLWTAGDRGVPVTIYRPGRILGDHRTGICNTRDRLSLMLRGCAYLGCAPMVDTSVDMTPVDYVSQAIVRLSSAPTAWGKAFHLCNPRPISWVDFVQQIQALGYPLHLVSYDQWQHTLSHQWQQHLQSLSSDIHDHPLHSLMILFSDSPENTPATATAVAQSLDAVGRQFDCHNAHRALIDDGIICPDIDPQLLQRYFTYFSRSGFMRFSAMV